MGFNYVYFSLRVNALVTAGKRSLGQGNVFTPVCHSLHGGCIPACNEQVVSTSESGGVYHPVQTPPVGRHHPRQIPTVGRLSPVEMTIEAGGTHPTGMHSFLLLIRCEEKFFLSMEWNSIKLGGSAHEIVTKTIHMCILH